MKRFQFVTTIDAETLSQARAEFIKQGGTSWQTMDLGFVHPDGQVRPCSVPPEGFLLLGNDAESGLYYAIPLEQSCLPAFEESGHPNPVPPNSLIWVETGWVQFYPETN
ncbi:MAG: hypothetical protein HY507_00960 [Candidatus Zambryskibacteria bacterium]|nr:hypothetical protein [Candidatus Zambryskibacteria bacterium]